MICLAVKPAPGTFVADEITFVHRGVGVVSLGGRETAFGPGATIYIPKDVRVAVRNTGAEPLSIAFVFSKPGFEAYLRRATYLASVPAGQEFRPHLHDGVGPGPVL